MGVPSVRERGREFRVLVVRRGAEATGDSGSTEAESTRQEGEEGGKSTGGGDGDGVGVVWERGEGSGG